MCNTSHTGSICPCCLLKPCTFEHLYSTTSSAATGVRCCCQKSSGVQGFHKQHRQTAHTRDCIRVTSGSQHLSSAAIRLDSSTVCWPVAAAPSAAVLAGSNPPSQALCWCRMLRMSCKAVLRTEREWSARAARGILIASSVVRLPRSSEMTALTGPVCKSHTAGVVWFDAVNNRLVCRNMHVVQKLRGYMYVTSETGGLTDSLCIIMHMYVSAPAASCAVCLHL